MFFIFGIAVAFFLELLLLMKKNKSIADKTLGVWLFINIIHISIFYSFSTGYSLEHPHLLGLDFPLPMVQGVFLFLYAKALTENKLTWKTVALHLTPSLIVGLFAIPFYMLSAQEKVDVYNSEGAGYEWYMLLNNATMLISGFAYAIWTYILTLKHAKNIRNKFSNIEKKELDWLKYQSIALSIIWLTVVVADSPTMIFSVVVLFILFIGFFGINQMSIFNSVQQPVSPQIFYSQDPDSINEAATPVNEEKEEKTEVKRYEKSGLTQVKSEEIYHELKEIMAENKIYLNNDLSLIELAKILNIHQNHLSQVINEKENKNFYSYINTLRIEEFITQAQFPENKNLTLLAIAFECGFNSKSTFNKHFKIYTGTTPKNYLSNLKTS